MVALFGFFIISPNCEFEIREITHLQSSAFSQKMYLCLF